VGKRKTSIAVALCDPRLMRSFREVAERLRIVYTVPRAHDKVVSADIVIIDDECLEMFKVDAQAAYLVSSSEDVTRVAYEVAGVRQENVLLVGIDIGSQIAYVAIVGGTIIDKGKVRSPELLTLKIRNIRNELGGVREVIVKVGIPESSLYDEVLEELIELLLKSGCKVYAVDENGTSSKPLPVLKRMVGEGDADINAAVNIALRDGTLVVR